MDLGRPAEYTNWTEARQLMKSYHYFSGVAGDNERAGAIRNELACIESIGGFEEESCEQFKTWFTQIIEGENTFKEFKGLCRSDKFKDLCDRIYQGTCRLRLFEYQINLESSDGEILKMDKSVATARSVVLKDLVDSTGGQRQIPVPTVSSTVLSQILDFCEKNQDFGKALKPILDQLVETIVGHYKGWVTAFLTSNQAILLDLHKAADFFDVPSLLTLTTQATKDLAGNAFAGISQWCENLSMSRLLCSLVV